MNVLLIGERANSEWRPHQDWRTLGPEQHVKLLLAMGAFKDSRSGRSSCYRLERSGVKWDAALNLCYPAKGEPWDAEQAQVAALRVREFLLPKAKLVILAGARVCKAFGHPYDFVLRHEPGSGVIVLQVPHPSGLCRLWNDPNTFERVRESYEKALAAC